MSLNRRASVIARTPSSIGCAENSHELAWGSATSRVESCLSGRTGRPARVSSSSRGTSAGVSGPTNTPSTDAIGAMSHAPRHSNERTLNSGSSPAASQMATYRSSAPRSEQEMFVHTYTLCLPTGLGLEHVVEAGHGREVRGGEVHHLRDLLDRLGRTPAVHSLRCPQSRQRRRAAVGIERHVRLDVGAQSAGHLDRGAGSGISAGSFSGRSRDPSRSRIDSICTGVSPVDPPKDGVEHRERGDHVGDIGALGHVRECLQVHERGVAHVYAGWLG